VLVLFLLVAATHALIFRTVFGFSWNLSLNDAVTSTLIITLSCWSMVLLVRSYPTTVLIEAYAILIAFLLAWLSIFAVWETQKLMAKGSNDYDPYILWLKQTMPVRFFIAWIIYGWMGTNSALRKNITAMDSRFQQHADAAALLKEAELFKLRQQLQPHFLYNSLNSISALSMISPDKAQEMIGKLSDFLRNSVKREAEDNLKINDELAYIETYLAIESVRFGDRLQVHIEKEYTDDALIPPFILQPILENSIKFGLYGVTGAVTISIHIYLDGPILTISVTNPFDPNARASKGTGFGLQGIRRRLFLLYARTDLLETKQDEQYFTTILKIPQNHV